MLKTLKRNRAINPNILAQNPNSYPHHHSQIKEELLPVLFKTRHKAIFPNSYCSSGKLVAKSKGQGIALISLNFSTRCEKDDYFLLASVNNEPHCPPPSFPIHWLWF